MNDSILQRDAFWTLLTMHLASDIPDALRRKGAFRWLEATLTSPDYAHWRGDVVRAIEDTVVMLLEKASVQGLNSDQLRHFILRMVLPLVQGPLINDIDPTLRRLVFFLIRMPDQWGATTVYRWQTEDGSEMEISVLEVEEEQAALRELQLVAEGQTSEMLLRFASVATTLTKPALEKNEHLGIRVQVPAIHLLLNDLNVIRPSLFDYLAHHVAYVDPPLARQLRDLRSEVLSEDHQVRYVGLQRLCLAYLTSTYFSLRRDLVHGIRKLQTFQEPDIAALCALPSLPEHLTIDNILVALMGANEEDISVPDGVTAVLLLCAGDVYRNAFASATSQWEAVVAGATHAGAQPPYEVLQRLCESALDSCSGFEALSSFSKLLSFAVKFPDESVSFHEQALTLREWIQNYVAFMLSEIPSRVITEAAAPQLFDPMREVEALRREVHCHCLRWGMWIAGSPAHARDLAEAGLAADRVVVTWTLQGLALAERLLLMIVSRHESLDDVSQSLHDLVRQLDVQIDPSAYPDMFNPFLFGTSAYDPMVATLLVILETTWDVVQSSTTTAALPLWWSDETRSNLLRIATREETEAEANWRAAKEQGRPNRLGLVLDRTPPEIARQLMERGRQSMPPV